MVEIPALPNLPAHPQRIVLHWTGGGPRASAFERSHYHYLVEQDGTVVAGVPVALNMRQVGDGGSYAAHTRGFNSYSVGVAFCGMLRATREDFGPYPLTESQVEAGCAFVARLCAAWGLYPTDPRRVFTHAEAGRLHGRPQRWKWDIDVLPWRPEASPEEAGAYLRNQIALHMPEAP